MTESTIVTIVVAFIGAVSAIVVALIQTRKEKPEQPTGLHLVRPLPPKKQIGFRSALLFVIAALLLGFIGGILVNSNSSASTVRPTQTQTPIVSSSPILSARDVELTAIASETQKAEQRSTLVALATHEADATATQNYIFLLQTAQANLEATRISEQAQQQVATEQAQKAEATAQAIISTQQTATAIANSQRIKQILSFAEQMPNLPVAFFDSFITNDNGWSPKDSKEYAVSFKGDELGINLSESSASPVLWTCEKCNFFSNFSYQVDVKFPKGAPGVASGIVFGSRTQLQQQILQGYYALLVFSSGDIFLEWISPSGSDIVQNWDHRRDLFTADGEFHTLQIIGIDKYAAVYIDGKPVGDVFTLDHSTDGYVGLSVQSRNVDVVFDNLKVVLLP